MRAFRVALTLATAGLIAVAGVTVAPAVAPTDLVAAAAAAEVSIPSIKVVYGDRAITVAWTKVPGVTGYKAQISTAKSFSSKTTIETTTKRSALFAKVKNGTKYYVRVVPVGAPAGTTAASVVKTAVPDDGYPLEISEVTVVSSGANTVTVSWKGGGRATHVGVIAGSDSQTAENHFDSGWYPATTRSIELKVPTKWRTVLGTGSGNPVYVKVAQTNLHAADPAMPRTYSVDDAYRLTGAGTRALAGVKTPGAYTERLSVVEYNVRSVKASSGDAGYTWADRKDEVANNIGDSGADLVGVQEAATSFIGDTSSPRQWQDLARLLKKDVYGGYAIANTTANDYAKNGMDATVSSHLFYKPDVLRVVSSGYISPKKDLGLTSLWSAANAGGDRYIAWAQFASIASGKTFYAVSVHLPAGHSSALDSLRAAEATALADLMDTKAAGSTIVLIGDLNSSFSRTPKAPSTLLVGKGYYDAAATAKRGGSRYSTENGSNQTSGPKGFPSTPYKHKYTASRIDYIMVKGSPGSYLYKNDLHLTSTGRFDRDFQGSDHNLQYAEIGID